MEKIIIKLNELKESLNNLKRQNHSGGEDDFKSFRNLIRRIIDRIYPEKDAKELKERLVHKSWIITGNETEEYWQKFYLIKINLSLEVINTILEEFKLFGFEDFKPIKEKVETEVQVGSNKFGFWRRKKSRG
jgi:ribosomal protein L29